MAPHNLFRTPPGEEVTSVDTETKAYIKSTLSAPPTNPHRPNPLDSLSETTINAEPREDFASIDSIDYHDVVTVWDVDGTLTADPNDTNDIGVSETIYKDLMWFIDGLEKLCYKDKRQILYGRALTGSNAVPGQRFPGNLPELFIDQEQFLEMVQKRRVDINEVLTRHELAELGIQAEESQAPENQPLAINESVEKPTQTEIQSNVPLRAPHIKLMAAVHRAPTHLPAILERLTQLGTQNAICSFGVYSAIDAFLKSTGMSKYFPKKLRAAFRLHNGKPKNPTQKIKMAEKIHQQTPGKTYVYFSDGLTDVPLLEHYLANGNYGLLIVDSKTKETKPQEYFAKLEIAEALKTAFPNQFYLVDETVYAQLGEHLASAPDAKPFDSIPEIQIPSTTIRTELSEHRKSIEKASAPAR